MRRDKRPTVSHGDRWRLSLSRAIMSRLSRRKGRIAELLEIDPTLEEWQQIRAPNLSGRNVASYIQWREAPPTGARRVKIIDLTLDEITGILRTCVALHRDLNHAPALPAVSKRLLQIARRPRPLRDFDLLDQAALVGIAEHHPGGFKVLETKIPHLGELQKAAAKAASLPPQAKRGRRKDEAAAYLAEHLAGLYCRTSGRPPSRRVNMEHGKVVEYGPFKDFVLEALACIPPAYRLTAKGHVRGVDHLVRMGVKHANRQFRPIEQSDLSP